MSYRYCASCGHIAEVNDAVCKYCGAPLTIPQQQVPYTQPQQSYHQPPQQYYQPYPVNQNFKIRGRGFGITSLTMGIITSFFSFITFMCINAIAADKSNAAVFFGVFLIFILIFYAFLIAILGVVFGCCAISRGYKNGVSKTGLIMSSISLGFTFISPIIFRIMVTTQ